MVLVISWNLPLCFKNVAHQIVVKTKDEKVSRIVQQTPDIQIKVGLY